jgi:hypothetical protein
VLDHIIASDNIGAIGGNHFISGSHKITDSLEVSFINDYKITDKTNPMFTASLSVFPALNAATLEALILIVLPVCGFLPVRAARALTTKEPKPVNCTLTLFYKLLTRKSKK